MKNFNTPILFIIFNRPKETGMVFEEIKKIKPTKLFVAADGPRNEDESKKCEKTREIIKKIDWNCEVKILFREKNLGCKNAVASAIDWFFSQVDMGIILEDDCVPSQSFFHFCSEMLSHHKDNKQIMCISGDNFQNGIIRGDGSYYFSSIPNIWGWATWKRAWDLYDVKMKDFPDFIKNRKINKIFKNLLVRRAWLKLFRTAHDNKIDTWDFQWTYALFKNNGLSINPNKNLITNIGFGNNATHTKEKNDLANLEKYEIKTIKHPTRIEPDKKADELILKNIFKMDIINFIKRRFSEIKKIIIQPK